LGTIKNCNFGTKIQLLSQKTITLTSDFGIKDFYSAVVTGRLLSLKPDLRIVTVTHQIQPYNIYEASVIVRNTWSSFPDGTVHLVLVNSTSDHHVIQVAIQYKNHFFIGPDSGIFGLIFEDKPEKIIALGDSSETESTFPELELCTSAAVKLAEGAAIDTLGTSISALLDTVPFKPTIEKNAIKGMVIYMDNYHNVITNITKKMFDKMNTSNKYTIRFGKYFTQKISPTYNYAPEGELVAVFGSTGLLEIALYKSSAKSLLGIRVNDVVRIEFE
jgi:hypothetical protein